MPESAVPASVPRSIHAGEGVAEEAVNIVEDVFLPRPGGMIDRFHQERERKAEQQREREQASEQVEERSYKAVKVTIVTPEVNSVNVITIQPGASAQLLPNSPYRYSAAVSLITAASTVLLAKDQSQAIGGIGYPLVTGTPYISHSRAQLYATNSGGAVVQVAVIAELYGPENQ